MEPGDACCAPPPAGAPDDGGDDPTMAACCVRDARERAAAARITALLRAADRVQAAVDARRRAVSRDPPPASEGSDDDLLSDDDDDEILESMRKARLRELRSEEEARRELEERGRGRLLELADAQDFAPGRPGWMVLHLSLDGWDPCAQVDEALATLAAEHAGTWFARLAVTDDGGPPVSLRGAPSPGVCVLKEGKCRAAFRLEALLEDGQLRERLLRSRLAELGALRDALGRPAAPEDPEDDEDGAAGEDWRTPCEVCGRTYPHVHVRSVRRSDGPDEQEEE